MKITLQIDIFGPLETAREHRAAIRQAVNAVLADQITHDRETLAEPIEASSGKPVGEISCSAIYAEAVL